MVAPRKNDQCDTLGQLDEVVSTLSSTLSFADKGVVSFRKVVHFGRPGDSRAQRAPQAIFWGYFAFSLDLGGFGR